MFIWDLFLTTTDNITSQNTEPSFWNTLYIHVKNVGLQKEDLPF